MVTNPIKKSTEIYLLLLYEELVLSRTKAKFQISGHEILRSGLGVNYLADNVSNCYNSIIDASVDSSRPWRNSDRNDYGYESWRSKAKRRISRK